MAKSKRTIASTVQPITQTNQYSGELISEEVLRTAARNEFLLKAPDRDRNDFDMPSDMALDFLLEHDIHSMDDLVALHNLAAACDLSDRLLEHFTIIEVFLPALQRFIDLGLLAMDALNGDFTVAMPGLEPQRRNIARLLNDVMVAYVPAVQETSTYMGMPGDVQFTAFIELLRRYWTFASYVKALALQVWPCWAGLQLPRAA